ncbi:MAG TPA: response regulator [Chthonomonadales bacterium]|nr:response regulator [Chthonomonadales bacterium]
MQQVKVLIADDDAVIRMDLRTMLEELGHQVICEADNGETAYQMARSLKPGLVILDIMMPRMSGLEAAAAISKERLAPVLLLTAYSEASMIESATQSGVLAYLVKPFRKQELQPAIEIAVARYRELSALEGELDSLREQMETRRIVGRAKAILMEREGIVEREAYRRLQAKSLRLNRPLREIAEAIILAEEMNTAAR